MQNLAVIHRRHVLTGLAAVAVTTPAVAQVAELSSGTIDDQSATLQGAIDGAMGSGRLLLPPGQFRISGLNIPGNLVIEGVPGATVIVAAGNTIATISSQSNVVLRDIAFAGDTRTGPLLDIANSENITIERCLFSDSPEVAVQLFASSGSINGCRFSGHGDAAIHAVDSIGLVISGNTVTRCGNAGIRVWRSEAGPDGSIVTNNRITGIDWRDGGNGQNGNGINVFLADEVIVADNQISDCAFTAIRLNTTRNTQVSGNQCHGSGEVAIFSEFGFSGSIIANNVVDGAAAGISMTNMDTEGQVAVCSGNIVRNIAASSEVNPDTTPYGIAAEADAVITGNLVQGVPGPAILAGWGPYLRNVTVADNVVIDSAVGIAVSVADGAGDVTISGNRLDTADHQIAGMLWQDVSEPDLAAVADLYPHVTIR